MYDVIYHDAHQRTAELIAGRPASELDRQVPACPEWTVAELVAHLAGVAADVVNGRVAGASTPEWTARQVAERRDRPVAENLAEWQRCGPAIERLLTMRLLTRAEPGVLLRIVHDLTQHEADLRGALGAGRPPQKAWKPMLDQVVARRSRFPGELVVMLGDRELRMGDGKPTAAVEADPYELWRALFGRRSRAQMAAWDWHGDPEPYLDALPVFPARAEDLIEAASPVD